MDITNVIIPKKSIGGVCIGESIEKIEAGLSGHYKIKKEQNSFTLDDGFIRAYYGPDGIITAIFCNSKFTGSYKNKLWAGMTVAEVLKHSKEQIAWSGFVQVDKISGIGLSNELYEHHKVEIKNYTLPDGETRTAYIIDSTFTLSTLPDGTIFSIGCNARYTGLYQKILSTGMRFDQIKKLTKRQRIFNGIIILTEDFGLCYVLPAPYDEIADSIENIPPTLTPDGIYVSDFSSWLHKPQ